MVIFVFYVFKTKHVIRVYSRHSMTKNFNNNQTRPTHHASQCSIFTLAHRYAILSPHMKACSSGLHQLRGDIKVNAVVLPALRRAGQYFRHALFQLFREIRAFRFEIMAHHQSHRGVSRQRPQDVHVHAP